MRGFSGEDDRVKNICFHEYKHPHNLFHTLSEDMADIIKGL